MSLFRETPEPNDDTADTDLANDWGKEGEQTTHWGDTTPPTEEEIEEEQKLIDSISQRED